MIELIESTELEKNPSDFSDVLDKLIEECAEVIGAASKVKAFGVDDSHNLVTNREKLTTEIGDVLCLVRILVDNNVIEEANVLRAVEAKAIKMQQWAPTVAKYYKG